MMKKIFSKYFVVAVVAVAVGCISSCKDFEDEMYSELRGEDQALKADLESQISDLRQELKDSVNKARQEREALQSALNAHVADAEAKYATKVELQNEVDALTLQMNNADAALKTELQGKINATNARIDSLNTEIAKIADQVVNNMNDIASLTGRIATLEQDYAKTQYVDTQIQAVKDMFADYYKKAEADAEFVDENELQAALKDLLNNQEAVESITQIINQQFYGDAGGSSGPVTNLSELRQLAEKADSTATANAAEIETLNELIKQIRESDCGDLVKRVTALETTVDSIENVCKDLEYNFEILQSQVDTLSGIEETKALAYEAQQKAEEFAKGYTDIALDAILDYVNPRFTSIDEMLAELSTTMEEQADKLLAHDASIAALNDSVNALRGDLGLLESRIEANEEAIKALSERMDLVEGGIEALDNRITGIVLQATKSPVIGYFNIPFGIKSNVLAAYYGEAMSNVYFPTIRTANLISGEAFTEEEAALLGFGEDMLYEEGEVLLDDAEGNAGTLYMTINPAEVNLEGVEFSLVNSLDEPSYVALSAPVASNEKLTFGYTRAANGFYEAKATVKAEDAVNAKMRVSFDDADMQGVISDLKNGITGGNLDFTSLASNIQSVVNDIADATAVKATWTDQLNDHNVYSEYALAAMTVKPLSFQFMQNIDVQNFPGLSRISNFIDNTIDKINIDLPKFDLDFTAPEIKKIEIKDFDELGVNCIIETSVEYTLNMTIPVEDVVVPGKEVVVPGETITIAAQDVTTTINGEEVTITIPAREIVVDGKKVTVEGSTVEIKDVVVNEVLNIPVKYDMTDIVKDLYGNVTAPIEDVNEMLGDLEAFMDDVNNMLEQLDAINDIEQSITDAKNSIKEQIDDYLELLNNKLCAAINSIHDRLQPNMLLKTTDGFAMLSQVKNKPTKLDATNCIFVPTTYTGELLVPVFKKYVAVTKVLDAEDNDVTATEIANVNTGNLNNVLPGSTTTIEFAGKSGYTYEIVYSALDYSGKYSNVKYYVTVQ